MKVVLMGYMGSGKSTLGKALAKVLLFDFIDLDDYISERENRSISEIFEIKGELYFRKKERYYLEEILKADQKVVLSLGGGTPCYGDNLKLIKITEDTKSFYLKTSIAVLSERLFPEKNKRPLISHLSSIRDLQEFIGKHLFERIVYYSDADLIIETDRANQQDLIETIITSLI